MGEREHDIGLHRVSSAEAETPDHTSASPDANNVGLHRVSSDEARTPDHRSASTGVKSAEPQIISDTQHARLQEILKDSSPGLSSSREERDVPLAPVTPASRAARVVKELHARAQDEVQLQNIEKLMAELEMLGPSDAWERLSSAINNLTLPFEAIQKVEQLSYKFLQDKIPPLRAILAGLSPDIGGRLIESLLATDLSISVDISFYEGEPNEAKIPPPPATRPVLYKMTATGVEPIVMEETSPLEEGKSRMIQSFRSQEITFDELLVQAFKAKITFTFIEASQIRNGCSAGNTSSCISKLRESGLL